MKISHKGIIVWLSVAAALCVVIIYAYGIKTTNSSSKSSYYIDEINTCLTVKDYEEAISLCTEALKDEPSYAWFYIKKAEAYKMLGRSDKAEQTLNYGYKLTKDNEIKNMLEEYSDSSDDAGFLPPDTDYENNVDSPASGGSGSIGNAASLANKGEFSANSIPEVSIPEVSLPEVSEESSDTTEDTSEPSAVSE